MGVRYRPVSGIGQPRVSGFRRPARVLPRRFALCAACFSLWEGPANRNFDNAWLLRGFNPRNRGCCCAGFFHHFPVFLVRDSRTQNVMILKPQDLLVTLKLLALGDEPWQYAMLAECLDMGQGEVHAAVKRGIKAGLLVAEDSRVVPMRRNMLEFVGHGVRYVFVPDRGAIVRGMPTAWAAPPLARKMASDEWAVPVWPFPEGKVRGESFSPLYRSVPIAADKDQQLYELLALVDAIRGGRSRERKMALEEFSNKLQAL